MASSSRRTPSGFVLDPPAANGQAGRAELLFTYVPGRSPHPNVFFTIPVRDPRGAWGKHKGRLLRRGALSRPSEQWPPRSQWPGQAWTVAPGTVVKRSTCAAKRFGSRLRVRSSSGIRRPNPRTQKGSCRTFRPVYRQIVFVDAENSPSRWPTSGNPVPDSKETFARKGKPAVNV